METAVNELISMLRPDLPFKVKVNATEIALRFTGDKEGGRIIKENKKFLEVINAACCCCLNDEIHI